MLEIAVVAVHLTIGSDDHGIAEWVEAESVSTAKLHDSVLEQPFELTDAYFLSFLFLHGFSFLIVLLLCRLAQAHDECCRYRECRFIGEQMKCGVGRY